MDLRVPTMEGIYDQFSAVAAAVPDNGALQEGGRRWSYAELDRQVRACAAGLQQRGCGAGDAVAVALGNSSDFVVATLATFAIGGVLVPLNPRFTAEELEHYVGACQPRAILFAPNLQSWVADSATQIPVRAQQCSDLATDAPLAHSAGSFGTRAGVHMFSSGSTGKSKRITRTQQQLLTEYRALAGTIGLSAADRVLCTVPLYHAHGFANAMLAALLSGGMLVVAGPEFNARATMNALEEHRISLYPSVPFMLKMLADTRFATAPDLSALRIVISAGAPLPASVAQKFFERFGVAISQLYGSTETGAMTVNAARATDKPMSVGCPLLGYSMEVRDEDGSALQTGESGEIWFRSTAMTAAYDDLPDVTAACFDDGWFFAGDTGYVDADGDLFVTGRKKLMINVAGLKVDPLEVENVLCEHPGVAEAVVIGVEHPGYGEKIKAVVVAKSQDIPGEAELIEFAAARLAPYKIPKVVEFRSEIPRSPLGKILRKYL